MDAPLLVLPKPAKTLSALLSDWRRAEAWYCPWWARERGDILSSTWSMQAEEWTPAVALNPLPGSIPFDPPRPGAGGRAPVVPVAGVRSFR